jgi:hypothetical protein
MAGMGSKKLLEEGSEFRCTLEMTNFGYLIISVCTMLPKETMGAVYFAN